jgi:hypothetical protein
MDYINQVLLEAFEHHQAGRLDQAESAYNAIFNRSLDNAQLMYLLGDLYCRKGYNALAATLLHACLTIDPKHQAAWINLGVALRHEHYNDMARAAWLRALELGENIEALSNMTTLYADTGQPEEALKWAGEALRVKPDHWESHWNSALARLTMRDWATGWDEYENRFHLERWDLRSKLDVPHWDGTGSKRVYLHGEQGVGDEIMFLSILPDLMAADIVPVIEVNKKLASLVKATWPGLEVYSSLDEALAAGVQVDAKCGLGSLGKFFRRLDASFPGTPYLKPDPALVEHYRQELTKLGPGPYIAVAWVGGVKSTRVQDRSLPLVNFAPIVTQGTAVCAQYGPHTEEAASNELPIIDDASRGGDLHHQAALFVACDAVTTVAQTAVHVAGAVGANTYVLTPSKPSWRYGTQGSTLPWYNSIKLFRQTRDDWGTVIANITNELKHDLDLGRVSAAQHATA